MIGDKDDIIEVAKRSRPAHGDEERYLRAWGRLHRWRAALAVSLVLWLPSIMVATMWDRDSAAFRWSDAVGFTGMAIFVLEASVLALTRCPRCGKHFTWTWYWKNPFTKECLSCGIRQGSLPVLGQPRVAMR